MPLYLFQHPHTGKVKEVLLGMNDPKEYSEKGVEWKRIWTKPQMSIDTRIDEFSSSDFVEKTGNKKGSFGDILDYSKEQSERRKERIGGIDPVKEKKMDAYAKKRRGSVHPDRKQDQFDKKMKKLGVKVD